MYREHCLLLAFFWALGLCVSLVFDVSYLGDVAGSVLTVLSIFFGFYMTSAATICSSPLYKKLHDEFDAKAGRCQRLSQTLKNYYRFGFNSLLFGIILFLIAAVSGKNICGTDSHNIIRTSSIFIYNGFLGAQLTLCLAFAFIQTKLFLVSFMNIAYTKEAPCP